MTKQKYIKPEPLCDSCKQRNRTDHNGYYWCDHYKSYALMMTKCEFYIKFEEE